MLSFTIAHVSVAALRYKRPDDELVFRARPNLRWRGVDWPLFAIVGGLGTGVAWLVVVIQKADARWAGLGWLALGFAAYALYRRRVIHQPLSATLRAPVVVGPAAALEYSRILAPVVEGPESEEAVDVACRLAAEGRRASIVALRVI